MAKKVAIVDYQLSNLFSVKHACEFVGLNAKITSDPKDVIEADGVILPGVGAFGDAMANLTKYKLDVAIKEFVNSGKPFMGICLGMQLIFGESPEFGRHKGLGLIGGSVLKFPNNFKNNKIKVPQVGWNNIYKTNNFVWSKTNLSGVSEKNLMYFVHSYYVTPLDPKIILTTTKYEGVEYTSSILQNNIFAVQFHPEKSSVKGLSIYKSFAESL